MGDCSGILLGNKKKFIVFDFYGWLEVLIYGLWMIYLDKLRVLIDVINLLIYICILWLFIKRKGLVDFFVIGNSS